MKLRTLRAIFGVALMLMLALTMPSMRAFAQEAAQDAADGQLQEESNNRSSENRRIVGVWDARVTIRRCDTGDPLINVRAMNMFNRGGTLTEISTSSSILRGPSLGTWQHLGGRRYSSVFRFFRFTPAGAFDGIQVVTRTLELSRDANEFTSTASFKVFDASDNLIRVGCATETATRLE